ncbi:MULTISPECIES: UDP-2,4-diacetamido-2,4,6-trideoxy-beta-L-altropyranose hydrolase [unclassified Acidovorax]|uniref:UDP-2,4-diacetamido-2,4, 6-trideoxy-beta-L-altropyranose hydrolase n=1 Tax=unclassified Acidovorax TaxID=2684926 RepID=UPI000BCB8636|nr:MULTISPECIES: UDP-2,4-diacetamido-2,4,6-trideoxy-beta-L-altropyranose hydrolase [unclassified Acidovorax]HQS20975.1 UDP-2,4-diacetamido-2,4,6-trideoxy-beta-L-altropyranose hydrolase [Acidovorax defluvii]OYY86076.1 MAG: UDP-2,4-diacetamido-2,4,6-trideoxy-beta-L-altropyranose hydrolase [Acidovorax sp. 28-64-14]OZA67361.1 MAG: UDP-2,4-diacetamido-2,4,6-trideoxy-beta-L-altropyranose hydrolase [Acidovorax sp. 39-64-12]HQT18915.1 UDP-2,4-diacetamido-2,4,6-trideoxy-beta-L-altropyranose hydrolase [A
MKIAFRADASLQMGSGHVMRCLTLADALKAQGADCHFISREHPGHLLEVIRQRGYKANCLVAQVQQAQAAIKNIVNEAPGPQQEPAHTAWLGSTWQADAQETAAILATLQPDWLVVDHYALDQRWEEALAPYYRKLLVIDDLADRPHRCDLLLDQNLGRQPQDYAGLVPAHCQLLIGPHFALLRPEFAVLRPYSLQRRKAQPALRQLLITMGGVDQPNATGQVLQALKTCSLTVDCRITVVMGFTAPWLQNVRELAAQMPWPTEVVVNVNDMAQRMADSDLAIGAAGSTSWERCCLGLPTLMVVLAENQEEAAVHLQNAGAANCLEFSGLLHQDLHAQLQGLIDQHEQLGQMSACASAITDGLGVERMVATMAMPLNKSI